MSRSISRQTSGKVEVLLRRWTRAPASDTKLHFQPAAVGVVGRFIFELDLDLHAGLGPLIGDDRRKVRAATRVRHVQGEAQASG